MEIGQILHTVLSIAAFVIALIAYSEVRSLRKEFNSKRGSFPESF